MLHDLAPASLTSQNTCHPHLCSQHPSHSGLFPFPENYHEHFHSCHWHVLSCMHAKSLFATPWTVALQAPLSVGFSRLEYWRWVAIPSSRGSSQPRDRTCVSYVSCIGRQGLSTSTTWEAHSRVNLNELPKLSLPYFSIHRMRIIIVPTITGFIRIK